MYGLSEKTIIELKDAVPYCRKPVHMSVSDADSVKKSLRALQRKLESVVGTLGKLRDRREPREMVSFNYLLTGLAMLESAPGAPPYLRAHNPDDYCNFIFLNHLEALHRAIDLRLKHKSDRLPSLNDVQVTVAVEVAARILERHGLKASRNGSFVEIVNEFLVACDLKADAVTALRAFKKRDSAATHSSPGRPRKKGLQAAAI